MAKESKAAVGGGGGVDEGAKAAELDLSAEGVVQGGGVWDKRGFMYGHGQKVVLADIDPLKVAECVRKGRVVLVTKPLVKQENKDGTDNRKDGE